MFSVGYQELSGHRWGPKSRFRGEIAKMALDTPSLSSQLDVQLRMKRLLFTRTKFTQLTQAASNWGGSVHRSIDSQAPGPDHLKVLDRAGLPRPSARSSLDGPSPREPGHEGSTRAAAAPAGQRRCP